MDFDLKEKDNLGRESLIITHTNVDMHFKTLSKKHDKNLIPESMDTSIQELNEVIHDLNKKNYDIFSKFRIKENEDFLAVPLVAIARIFPFLIISCVLIYICLNLEDEDAR